MNKALTVERIFSLGDYQNIKFSDTITEIPDTIIKNQDSMRLIKYLQLVDIEWSYLRYMNLRREMPKILSPESIEEALSFVEAERIRTFSELLATITE